MLVVRENEDEEPSRRIDWSARCSRGIPKQLYCKRRRFADCSALSIDSICIYLGQPRAKCRTKLRFRPRPPWSLSSGWPYPHLLKISARPLPDSHVINKGEKGGLGVAYGPTALPSPGKLRRNLQTFSECLYFERRFLLGC